MEKKFSSRALEVNLEKTRTIEIAIPLEQEWFIDLSKSNWGIHKRTKSFVQELNHQYINHKYVIEELHNISLTDLWFYNSLDESEKALRVLTDIFKKLFTANLEESLREQLITTILKFMDRLVKLETFPKSIIHECFDIIQRDMKNHEILYVRNSGYFKTYFNKIARLPEFNTISVKITRELLEKSIMYWEETARVEEWFKEKNALFQSKSNDNIQRIGSPFFDELKKQLNKAKNWEELSQLFFFNDISNYFRLFTEEFDTTLEKIYFINYLLHLPGMLHLNNHLLYDMNRHLRNVLNELDEKEIKTFLKNILQLFAELQENHKQTVLDCILTLGKEVIDTKTSSTISYFVKGLIELGFTYPGELKINNDWQIQVNTNHVKNIRVWLELIAYAPYDMKELLTALIVNLKLGGIFISDTDLFQRDVTKLLNSNISSVYREIKQLARIFPVYFKDIGAEGELREVSTAIDELSRRKDRLIHFLRKQIHTESNNTHIKLTKKIMCYWKDGDINFLKEIIPEDVLCTLNTKNKWFVGVHNIMVELCHQTEKTIEELILMDLEEIQDKIDQLPVGKKVDKKRVFYLFKLYSLVLEKYSLESEDIIAMIEEYKVFNQEDIQKLEVYLEKNDIESAIYQIYSFMKKLKDTMLDPKETVAQENIYYKRHIAIGIPSMYGQYIEPKFEALGLMYRLEKTASNLMTKLLQSSNFEYITAKTFRHVYNILSLFRKGLKLEGIQNQGFDSNLEMLKYSLASPSVTLDQYINIFQFMAQNIQQIISEYFLDLFEEPLKMIIPQIYEEEKKQSLGQETNLYYIESEKFFRENLSSAFLVQDLDNFLTNMIGTMRSMIDHYPSNFIENMMTYDPDLTISPLYKETLDMDNPVFLGAKAYFLKKLISYDVPVPPGFVLTTEVFRHNHTINNHPYMEQEMDQFILNHIWEIEKMTRRQFGNPANPLLFSVRSGTAISMPGAMRTFLNIGMNDEIAETLGQNPEYAWTSWDCYRRFIQSWGMAYGIPRDVFDGIIGRYKQKYQVDFKIQFTPNQMREIAYSYKKALQDYNIKMEENPFKQLKQAIQNVIYSWSSNSARYYRDYLQIADEWGTAIIVQKMALGNLSKGSGTGVLFTNNPLENNTDISLYGDFTLYNQGEDVVSGLVETLPISENQRIGSYNDSPISLETEFPEIYHSLLDLAEQLIGKYGFMHQEIEFTFESDKPEDLYILQIRNQNRKKKKEYSTFVQRPNEMQLVGRGIGIGGGVLSGILVFSEEDLKIARKNNPKEKFILVRPDTVPDDIPMIFQCEGLLTAKGGTTSHAAVAAEGLGKVCVVNCRGLVVNETEKKCRINGVNFITGDILSIDGNNGNVYHGKYDIVYQ